MAKEVMSDPLSREELQEYVGWQVDPAILSALHYLARVEELEKALEAVGLPQTASVEGLIRHHRNNAEFAIGFQLAAAEARVEELERKIEDAETDAENARSSRDELVAAAEARVEKLERERDELQEAYDKAVDTGLLLEAQVAKLREWFERNGLAFPLIASDEGTEE